MAFAQMTSISSFIPTRHFSITFTSSLISLRPFIVCPFWTTNKAVSYVRGSYNTSCLSQASNRFSSLSFICLNRLPTSYYCVHRPSNESHYWTGCFFAQSSTHLQQAFGRPSITISLQCREGLRKALAVAFATLYFCFALHYVTNICKDFCLLLVLSVCDQCTANDN